MFVWVATAKYLEFTIGCWLLSLKTQQYLFVMQSSQRLCDIPRYATWHVANNFWTNLYWRGLGVRAIELPSAILLVYRILSNHSFRLPFVHSNSVRQSVLCTALDIPSSRLHNHACILCEGRYPLHPQRNKAEQTQRSKFFSALKNRQNYFQIYWIFFWARDQV